MKSRTFFDTNVLVYADDAAAGAKHVTAIELVTRAVERQDGVLSTQVLQEYFNTATRRLGVPAELARRKLEGFARLDVVTIRLDIILGAIDLHRLNNISFWDALVVRCASSAGCTRVLTEDLNHGQVIDGVRVENPFA